ncbi:MAG: hypothetical protein HC924_17865 [Synechococcaceae cyanobacterium SM2_3_2]|nr:hypothetical protein [Synechococcaceae cyanobacterium SM2_3_2]
MDKSEFLYPRHSYSGDFTPENMMFNANLQEFSQRVGIICALETNGKLSAADAYNQIKSLWKALKNSKKELVDNPSMMKGQDLEEEDGE